MSFSSLMTDTVSILKKSGERFDGVKASVQTNKIFISGAAFLIEPGDFIQRRMSNGGEETFEVIDPGFREKFNSIPAGYQSTVRKLGIAQGATKSITYNISGASARVNHNSTDNSVNVASVEHDAFSLIAALRSAVQEADLLPEEKRAAVDIIDAVDTQFQSERPSKSVVATLLAALPHVANVVTIITSILALL